MSKKVAGGRNGAGREVPESRPVRADAQRNMDALLKAALAVFATSGVDAPVREIAEKAGVGVGTVYRHFPERSDLIAAVMRREIDACAWTMGLIPVPPSASPSKHWRIGCSAMQPSSPPNAGSPRRCTREIRRSITYRVTSTSGCGRRFARCSRLRSPPARSAPMSMLTSFWARWRACACRPTMPDLAVPSAWSLCSSTGYATARGRDEFLAPPHKDIDGQGLVIGAIASWPGFVRAPHR